MSTLKKLGTFVVVFVLFGLVVIGGLTLASAGMQAITGWPWIPQPRENDRYKGEWYKVVQTVPAEDIVDRTKLTELGGEECRFFVTNGSAHPYDHDVQCVILRKE